MGAYRDALQPLDLGDVSITEVFDPSFGADRNVSMIRIQAQDEEEAITADATEEVRQALADRGARYQLCLGRNPSGRKCRAS